LFNRLSLGENGLDLDTEVNAALLRLGFRPFEVPISSRDRTAGSVHNNSNLS
jgi:hypothetical protein